MGLEDRGKGAGKTSHPGNAEMVMTADVFVFSDQRHWLYLPKWGRPPPGCGCLQCSLPVDGEKGFLFCWCQSHGRVFKNKHPSKVGEACSVWGIRYLKDDIWLTLSFDLSTCPFTLLGYLGFLKDSHSFLVSGWCLCDPSCLSLISEDLDVRRVCKWWEGSWKEKGLKFWIISIPLFSIKLVYMVPNALRRLIIILKQLYR